MRTEDSASAIAARGVAIACGSIDGEKEMGSLGEVDHAKEMFHGHGHSDPVVDELNRLQNLLRGLFMFYIAHMHAYMIVTRPRLIDEPVVVSVRLHFSSITNTDAAALHHYRSC